LAKALSMLVMPTIIVTLFCVSWVFEKYDLFDKESANNRLVDEIDEIRVAEAKDKIVIYCPYSWNILLRLDAEPSRWEGIELESPRIFKPSVKAAGSYLKIGMAEYNTDVLIIGQS